MLRPKLFGLAGLLASAALFACSAPDAVEIKTYDAKTFYDTVSLFGSSFSADEKRLLISSDADGVFNVYSQPVEGGPPEKLTNSAKESFLAVGWFPHDDRFLYTADQGGNELNHLYVRLTDGTSQDLTPGERVKASFVRWSADGKGFWVQTNERDPRFFDLYRYSADDYSRKQVFTNDEGWLVGDVSRDGRYLALAKVRNNVDSNIYLYTLEESAKPVLITQHEGDVNHSPLSFSPDGTKLYYLTDEFGEFTQAWSHDVEGGEKAEEVTGDWDVMFVSFSDSGRYRISAANEDAKTAVTIVDVKTDRRVELPHLPEGAINGVRFSPSEKRMAFYLNSDVSPSNLYLLDLESGDHRRLSDSLNPAIDRNHLVESEVVRYPSFDDLKIPALLYRPRPASAQNRVPALVWVHGGPGGQSRKGYRAAIQHLVNHGYAILAVNNRGSSGYGKTFNHMDDRKHGEVDLDDCVWGRRYLEGLDWVDQDRIGIIGGSYGGYMVAAALSFRPEVFDVGIDIFGVTNWVRTLTQIPPWWAAFREGLYAEMGDPATDEERLKRISPLLHADKIKRPMLVVQGANDPRVKQAESDEIVQALRDNNVPVEYLLFEDEGHGFRHKKNRIAASEKYLQFLDQYLRN